MLGRFTLDLDPVDRGRSTVGGLVAYAVVYEKSNVRTVCFGFQADDLVPNLASRANVGPLYSVILGFSTSSHKVLICEDLGPHDLQPMHVSTLSIRS
ncbi:hypothetical protein M9H77_21927 [Catharanthus roseus]|uniref:Uncharacterized protein n=1 Tax=Catharanthus roseus TaxID=4058 RepID=A0ACC0AP29_CATRO|nr:hypothetical protein M9H77_21927 [Catharanthus roseus]